MALNTLRAKCPQMGLPASSSISISTHTFQQSLPTDSQHARMLVPPTTDIETAPHESPPNTRQTDWQLEKHFLSNLTNGTRPLSPASRRRKGASDRGLPEEQFLQRAGRSGHTTLLLHSIDRDFSAVAKMPGYQRYRPGNQAVDQFSERDILPKPLFPKSIRARH